jgi:hypothetical protein
METDFKNIKKLPPYLRKKSLNQLKELLEKKIKDTKKEIEEAENLIEQAKTEEELIEEIEIPKTKKIQIEDLFKEKKEEKDKNEIILKNLSEEDKKNIEQISKEPIEQIYERIKNFASEFSAYKEKEFYTFSNREVSEKRREIYEMILLEKRKAVESGEYKINEKAEHLMTASEKLTYKKS